MRTASCIALLCFLAIPRSVRADEAASSGANGTMAERMFLEGRVLADRGDVEGACIRFETSHKLEPSAGGPVLNLALCKEALFQYASAAAFFREVIERSQGTRADRVELAQGHLRTLEPKISSIQVVVPTPRPPGLEVRVDDRPLSEASWGVDVPTDGGPHVVTASAPKMATATMKVSLEREHGHLVVRIPPLEPVRSNTTVGYAVGAAGVAVLAVGIVLGTSVAMRCGGFFRDTCDEANGLPGPERQNKLDALDTQAWISNVAVGAGLMAIGVGTFLLLTSPKDARASAARLFRSTTPLGTTPARAFAF